jgi:hypothetical protein
MKIITLHILVMKIITLHILVMKIITLHILVMKIITLHILADHSKTSSKPPRFLTRNYTQYYFTLRHFTLRFFFIGVFLRPQKSFNFRVYKNKSHQKILFFVHVEMSGERSV